MISNALEKFSLNCFQTIFGFILRSAWFGSQCVSVNEQKIIKIYDFYAILYIVLSNALTYFDNWLQMILKWFLDLIIIFGLIRLHVN